MHALEPTRDWIIAPIDASQSITHEKSIEQVAAKDRQQVTISIVRPPMRAELETNELSRSMTFFVGKTFIIRKEKHRAYFLSNNSQFRIRCYDLTFSPNVRFYSQTIISILSFGREKGPVVFPPRDEVLYDCNGFHDRWKGQTFSVSWKAMKTRSN